MIGAAARLGPSSIDFGVWDSDKEDVIRDTSSSVAPEKGLTACPWTERSFSLNEVRHATKCSQPVLSGARTVLRSPASIPPAPLGSDFR